MKILSRDEMEDLLYGEVGPGPQVKDMVNRWLERGDGIAVYTNADFGSPQMGHHQFTSFGSEAAQLVGEAPQRMPDIGGAINWRYVLQATYKGEALGDPVPQ